MRNNPKKASYNNFLRVKFIDEISKIVNDSSDDFNSLKREDIRNAKTRIREYIKKRNEEIAEYIKDIGRVPIRQSQRKYIEFLENIEPQTEDLYIKEIKVMYQHVEIMKTDLYEKNVDVLRDYIDTLENLFGIRHELRPPKKEKVEKNNPHDVRE